MTDGQVAAPPADRLALPETKSVMRIKQTNRMTLQPLLAILFIFVCIKVSYARVLKDVEKQLQSGTSRVFLGVVLGDVATIKQGIEEGGNVVTPFDPFIAETILKLGEPYVDYPICPPLHLAFNYGQKDHANVAAYLLRLGADVNAYQLPTHPKNYFDRGYPPAMLYSLGLGQYPTNTHAAFLQRIYRSYGDRFNLTKIEDWRVQTDNPPLLHMSIALKAFDSVYVLLSEFPRIATIHTRDQFNMTALHYAAYREDLRSLVMLLYNQASTTAQDVYGHTPLHLAVMRGEGGGVSLLLASTQNNNRTTLAQKQKYFLDLLHVLSRDRVDALDMMCLSPLPMPLLHTLFYLASLLSLSPHGLPRIRNDFQHACIERAMAVVSTPRALKDLMQEEMR
ncbi:ankyrin repeat domain-containing protein, partial [archaeon]